MSGCQIRPNEYFRYEGSLTTEPYTENVSWVVLKHFQVHPYGLLERFDSTVQTSGSILPTIESKIFVSQLEVEKRANLMIPDGNNVYGQIEAPKWLGANQGRFGEMVRRFWMFDLQIELRWFREDSA